MARNFRPVQEIWGEASGCFVEDVPAVLRWIAEFGDCGKVEQTAYGDNISVWIEKGSQFLDTVAAYRFRRAVVRELDGEDASTIRSICSNLRILASMWRNSLNDDGSLTFYIDAW